MATEATSLIDKAPQIIEASAKSPLALAALIVLVLGFLAYSYFREAKEVTRTIAFVVMGVVALLLLLAILSGVNKTSGPVAVTPTQEKPAVPAVDAEKPSKPPGETLTPKVAVGTPVISHGFPGPRGPGIRILLPGSIRNAQGQTGQLVVNFAMMDGAPVWANAQETEYRAANGLVATGTSAFLLSSDNFDLAAVPVFIPYFAFNMAPSGYSNRFDLQLVASVYLNGVVMARSPAAPFSFLW